MTQGPCPVGRRVDSRPTSLRARIADLDRAVAVYIEILSTLRQTYQSITVNPRCSCHGSGRRREAADADAADKCLSLSAD